MFEKATYLSLIAIVICCALWVMRFAKVTSSDYAAFKEEVQRQEIAAATTPSGSTANQQRQGVRKEIWFTQEDNSRLHYRIESESSQLSLIPFDKKLQLTEKLIKMKCWMQDKIYTTGKEPMQQMRFFEAEEGIYLYNTQKFFAQAVTLSLFRLPGKELPEILNPDKSFMKGLAQDVSFSVSGRTPQFQAKQFKATLRQED